MGTSLTQLLEGMRAGDPLAADKLYPMAYAELRRLAASMLRSQRAGHTLQATALVHEAYLKLLGSEAPSFTSRSHFFAVAARMMRQILVDHARKHLAHKRGAGAQQVQWEDAIAYSAPRAQDLLDLHEALEELERVDERKSRVIEMRYFAGMTAQEIAESLQISTPTVTRDLRVAQAWLSSRLRPAVEPEDIQTDSDTVT